MVRAAHLGTAKRRRRAALLGLAAVLLACGCIDDDAATHGASSVLLDFEASACQREQRERQDSGTSAADFVEPCVDWRLDSDDTLHLDFVAVPALCLEADLARDVPWQPSAVRAAPDRLELAVVWPSENTPACGPCLYDFSFAVEAPDWQDALEVTFEARSCPSCAPETRRVSLSPPSSDAGQVVCETDAR